MACCLLSEAVEVFIKRILVSTLSSCNDSLDLTSQRLHLMQKMNVEPPLGVEMGCDVGKQVRFDPGCFLLFDVKTTDVVVMR